jgi:DHA2 family multidrug resistance protein
VWTLVDFDEPDLSLLEGFDWAGLLSMAVFLGSLEYFLEEGPAKDWFESELILAAGIVALAAGTVFFWRTFTVRRPIVDLGAFADRNFWTGSLCSFIMGIGLYGLTYLYPVYLARVRGLSALQIGETMFVTGLCMFFTAPITGRLMGKVDPRAMIAFGFTLFSVGTLQASAITMVWDFDELLVPQILRGIGIMMAMVPINNLALGTLAPDRLKNAAGLYNLTRNLGGAVGLALINTLLNHRFDLHLQRMHEQVAWSSIAAQETLASLTQAMARLGSDAELAALRRMGQIVRQQAFVLSMGDVFFALTWLFLVLVMLTPLMQRPGRPGAGGGH